jgi:hypothetical protein
VLELSRQLATTTWQLQRTQQHLQQLQQVQAEQQGCVEAAAAAHAAPSQPRHEAAASGAAGPAPTLSAMTAAAGGEAAGSSSNDGTADPMQQRMELLMPLPVGQDVRRAAVSGQQRPVGPQSPQQLQRQRAAAFCGSPPAAVPAAPDALELPRFAEVQRQAVGLSLSLGSTAAAAAAAAPNWCSAAGEPSTARGWECSGACACYTRGSRQRYSSNG